MTFQAAFTQALTKSGLSLGEISRRCSQLGAPVSTATLSFWKSGRTKPGRKTSQHVIGCLEHILGLEFGALLQLADGSQSVEWTEGVRPDELVPAFDVLAEAREMWGLPPTDGLDRVHVITHYTLRPTEIRNDTRAVFAANRHGADRHLLSIDATAIPESVQILHGATIGRSVELPGGNWIFEVLFHRPLQKGEVAVIEWADLSPSAQEDGDAYHLYSTRSTDLMSLNVTFDGVPRPESIRRTRRHLDCDGKLTHIEDTVSAQDGKAQATLTLMEAGHVGLAW